MSKRKIIWKMLFIVVILIIVSGLQTNLGGVTDRRSTDKVSFRTPQTSTDPTAFISVWNTSLTSSGSSNKTQIKLPLESSGNYSFFIQWGDGSNSIITSYNQIDVTHNYNSSGVYTLTITGTLNGWAFSDTGDRLKILNIEQWGSMNFGNSGANFYGCQNLIITATDAPDLTGVNNLAVAFEDCYKLGNTGNWNGWDLSQILLTSDMFHGDYMFNQDISSWDVSNDEDLNNMFYGASAFNQNISSWNVKNAMMMGCMFYDASSFNQNLSSWNVINANDMHEMFDGDTAFSSVNYNSLLEGWAKLNLYPYAIFSAASTQYWIGAPANARQYIINTFNWTITDGGLAHPSTPVLSPISSPSYTGNITLDWSPSVSTANYTIYRSNSNITNPADATMIASNVTDTTYQDTNLTPGNYYYAIVATNGVYNSQISNCENVTVYLPPFDPTNLNATVGAHDISLTWVCPGYNGGSSVLYYKIYRANSSNGQFILIGNSTITAYADNNVISGQTYYYKVSAMNVAGESSFSNFANTMAIFKTSEPNNLSATPYPSHISLTWESPIDNGGSIILYYNIYRSDLFNGQFTLIGNSATTSYIDYSAVEGQTYYYDVSAVNTVGESSFSKIVNSIILLKPSDPMDLNATVGTNFIELTWESPTNNGGSSILYYDIYRANSSSEQFILIGNFITTSYKDYNVVDGQNYYYEISAVNSLGESHLSNVAHVDYTAPITLPKVSFGWLIFGVVGGVTVGVIGGVAAAYIYFKKITNQREIFPGGSPKEE